MASVTKITGSGTQSGSGNSWLNPGNITSGSDASYASVNVYPQTYNLLGSDFGFTIPDGSTIDGIEVVIRAEVAGGTPPFDRASIDSGYLVIGGSTVGSSVSSGTLTTAFEDYTFGGPTDTWGQSLTASDVNASNFGFQFQGQQVGVTNNPNTVDVSQLHITVYYTLPAAVISDVVSMSNVTSLTL